MNKNKKIYDRIESLSNKKHRCTPAQLALAWVLQQGDDVVPIPGEHLPNFFQNLLLLASLLHGQYNRACLFVHVLTV